MVDRRFNREQFDAERAVESFAYQLRDEVDPEQVVHDLISVVERTVAPSDVALWQAMNRASWVALARWTLITLFVVGVTWHIAEGLGGDPGILVPIAVYTVVGALVTSRRPANPIGWVFLGVAGVTGIGSTG